MYTSIPEKRQYKFNYTTYIYLCQVLFNFFVELRFLSQLYSILLFLSVSYLVLYLFLNSASHLTSCSAGILLLYTSDLKIASAMAFSVFSCCTFKSDGLTKQTNFLCPSLRLICRHPLQKIYEERFVP